MNKFLAIALLALLFFSVPAQTKGTGPEETSVKKELRSRKQLRKESKERRRLEKAERKKIKKHHKRIQTKAVRKRMKSSKKQAVRTNENKREFFITRWFKKKKGHPRPAKKD